MGYQEAMNALNLSKNETENVNDNNNNFRWSCSKCTFFNELDVKQCAMCGALQPNKQQKEGWNCSVCTFLNGSNNSNCQICGASKDKKMNAFLSKFEQEINGLFATKHQIENKEKAMDRIECILSIYSFWIASPNKSDINIHDLINIGLSAANYSFIGFLSDYKIAMEEEKKKLLQLKDCECADCNILNRYGRDRQTENISQLFFVQSGNTESEASNLEIVAQETLDTIHCFLYHSFRVNMDDLMKRKNVNQNGNETEDKMIKILKNEIRQRSKGRKATQREIESESNSKFVTNNSYNFKNAKVVKTEDSVDCFMDNVLNDLKRHKLSANAVDALNDKLLNTECYETDSFIMDLGEEKHSNIINMIQSLMPMQEEKSLAIKRCKENILMLNNIKNTYSASFRFFYWPFYRNNTDRINMIYKVSNCVVSEGNDGYKLCDWYIPQIYGNFKEEMLQNNKASFDIMQWNGTKIKATQKYEAWKEEPSYKLICGFSMFDEDGDDLYLA